MSAACVHTHTRVRSEGKMGSLKRSPGPASFLRESDSVLLTPPCLTARRPPPRLRVTPGARPQSLPEPSVPSETSRYARGPRPELPGPGPRAGPVGARGQRWRPLWQTEGLRGKPHTVGSGSCPLRGKQPASTQGPGGRGRLNGWWGETSSEQEEPGQRKQTSNQAVMSGAAGLENCLLDGDRL